MALITVGFPDLLQRENKQTQLTHFLEHQRAALHLHGCLASGAASGGRGQQRARRVRVFGGRRSRRRAQETILVGRATDAGTQFLQICMCLMYEYADDI